MERDRGVPSVAAGTHPKRGLGRYLQSERAQATRLDGVCLWRWWPSRRSARLPPAVLTEVLYAADRARSGLRRGSLRQRRLLTQVRDASGIETAEATWQQVTEAAPTHVSSYSYRLASAGPDDVQPALDAVALRWSETPYGQGGPLDPADQTNDSTTGRTRDHGRWYPTGHRRIPVGHTEKRCPGLADRTYRVSGNHRKYPCAVCRSRQRLPLHRC